ncbi:MAG: RNase adapter RapZ [Gallicola sp.]|nr:RNase adapter RapZ [Gallicola sp.]
MEIVIITGISGAGKSSALDIFEDMGYYSMDNLPPRLLTNFAELSKTSMKEIDRLAVVADIRGGIFFNDLIYAINKLKAMGERVSILFLDASDEILIRRYKELRRPHPLVTEERNLLDAIHKERGQLSEIRKLADNYIDTTGFILGDFKNRIHALYESSEESRGLNITVMSFGFKHGIPLDADLVFDVRFLPNPYYEKNLKPLNGRNKEVADFVFDFPVTKEFIKKALDMLEFLIPHYINEGKSSLVVGIGCTGGKHRSVAITEKLSEELEKAGEITHVSHRDSKLW